MADIEIDELVTAAEQLARTAHRGQVDKAGADYIEHPRRVAHRVRAFGSDAQAVAWLHDVVEDCGVTTSDLREAGFPAVIVEAVDALTKRPGEDHAAAVRRACENRIAKLVKAADVADNSDPLRLALLDEESAGRLRDKYDAAQAVLDAAGAPDLRRPLETPPIVAFDRAVEATHLEKPEWRLGQTMFNVLFEMRRDLAHLVIGTEMDPFHRDERVEAFRRWLAENW
jgi:hypothetical protein